MVANDCKLQLCLLTDNDDANQIRERDLRKPVIRDISGSVAKSFMVLKMFTLCCQFDL